ncbi:MAG: hypothetical protein IJJ15_10535 [Ruminococcus sp.]|nr:hypothetical protein [Ruminococcus sp.]
MAEVIRRQNIEKKLYLSYSLNIIDWVCTLFLLSSGGFYEANPVARLFIGSITLGFLIKCALPLLIVVTVSWALSKLSFEDMATADSFVCFLLVFYIAINLDHLINFILLFSGAV